MKDDLRQVLLIEKIAFELSEFLNSDNYEIFETFDAIEIRDLAGRKIATATTVGEKTVFYGDKMYDLDIFSIDFDKSKIKIKE